MSMPILLLTLAVICAVAYGFAGARGLILLGLALLIAAVVAAFQSTNALMAVSYGLAFGFPALIACAALGAFSGALFRKGRYAIALLPFVPIVYFIWHSETGKQNELAEKEQVFAFVHGHKELERLTGQLVKARLSSSTTFSDKHRGRYEFRLEAKKPLYAIVDVDRSTGHPKVSLACVTSLYMGRRDVRKDACEQDVVALDDTSWAIAANPAKAAEQSIPEVPPIPPDARVSMIGVYESAAQRQRAAGTHEPGEVKVNVAAGKSPLVLVLSSYEPVHWVIVNAGRPISAVLLSGHYPSTVAGTGAKTVPLGRMFAYDNRGEQYEKLKTKVAFYAPSPIRFQGSYYGAEFLVPAD
jgi:hypothetical protein